MDKEAHLLKLQFLKNEIFVLCFLNQKTIYLIDYAFEFL